MEVLYFLEKIRLPGLNELMLGLTALGEETAFLVIALVMFWCVDKRRGYYILSVGFLGTLANQFLKLLCRIPRPWVLDENFTILEPARGAATGYSFPSGHTQSAVGVFGGIAYTTKRTAVRVVCIVLAILVPFSRMYVGVHTPYDVLAAAAMALALVFLLEPVVMEKQGKGLPVLLGVMAAASAAYLVYVELFPFPADVDEANLLSGRENAYTLLGAILGLLVVYGVDEKWEHFPVEAPWPAQCLKTVLGLVVVVAAKEGLKPVMDGTFQGLMVGRLVRYFLVVLVAGLVWPLTFPYFARLGKKSSEDPA